MCVSVCSPWPHGFCQLFDHREWTRRVLERGREAGRGPGTEGWGLVCGLQKGGFMQSYERISFLLAAGWLGIGVLLSSQFSLSTQIPNLQVFFSSFFSAL